MIIVKLWGGMCNQMFQYALGYALSKKYNDELFFDVEFYQKQPKHVGKRNIIGNEEFPNITSLKFIDRPSIIKPFENKYISHIIRYNWGCSIALCNISLVIEKLHVYYSKLSYNPNKNNYYDGYWQTARYFKNYELEIRKEFEPRKDILAQVKQWRNNIDNHNCVAVHIRRGDYLNKVNQASLRDGNVIGDVSYYMRAIDYMKEKLDDPIFCFFSDDIQWCKKTFDNKDIKTLFVENKGNDSSLLDLFSIAQCEHGIMSPSTFSWWGNWLRNKEGNSIVIGPKGDHSNEYFIDGNWIKM